MAETAKSRFRMYVSLAAAALLLAFSLITASTEVVQILFATVLAIIPRGNVMEE